MAKTAVHVLCESDTVLCGLFVSHCAWFLFGITTIQCNYIMFLSSYEIGLPCHDSFSPLPSPLSLTSRLVVYTILICAVDSFFKTNLRIQQQQKQKLHA